MASTRHGRTHSTRVGDLKFYLTINEDDEGKPFEIFLMAAKQGSIVHGLCDTVAVLVSKWLQHGGTAFDVVDAMLDRRYEPLGETNDPDVPSVKSMTDYIARRIAVTYLSEQDQARLGLNENGAQHAG